MKFGTTLEELKKNPLFSKYLPEGSFLNYSQLKKSIKQIQKSTESSEEMKKQFIQQIESFLEECEQFISGVIKKSDPKEDWVKNIKIYKSLEEYANINAEAVRKICKKFDKVLQHKPSLQKEMLKKMKSLEIGNKFTILQKLKYFEDLEQKNLDKADFNQLKQDVISLREFSDEEGNVLLEEEQELPDLKNKDPKSQQSGFYSKKYNSQAGLQTESNSDQISSQKKQEELKESLTFLQWLKKNKSSVELSLSYIIIMVLPVFISPIIKGSASNIETIFYVTIPLSFFLGAALGGNDICNSVGTCYGSRTLTMKQSLLLGIFFEVLGAMTLGGAVSKTISKKIIDPEAFVEDSNLYAVAMTSVLAGAAFSVCSVTVYGIPVSITKAVIFGLTSAGIVSMGGDGISIGGLGKVLLALITSPVVGALISGSLYGFIICSVKKRKNPFQSALNWLPLIGFVSVSILMYITLFKGAKLEPLWSLIGALCSAFVVTVCLCIFTQTKKKNANIEAMDQEEQQDKACSLFNPLLIISASAGAFAHGANNVGNSIGPLVGVYGVYDNGVDSLSDDFDTPIWALILGSVSFAVGILSVGERTIKTLGNDVTKLDPMKAYAIQIGSAFSILLASILGIPVSTSHVSVGTLIGATMAEKFGGYPYVLKWKALNKMIASWFYTIPFVFFFVVYFFYSFKGVFY